MKKLFIVAAALVITGCATQQQGQVTGAAVGAAIGSQVLGPRDSQLGAATGAVLGTIVGGELYKNNRQHRQEARYEGPHDPYQICNRYYEPKLRTRCIQDIWQVINRK